jgi:hypothetical protein
MRARMRCSLRCSGVRRGACGFGLSIVFSIVVQGTVTQGVTIDLGPMVTASITVGRRPHNTRTLVV